MSFELTADEKAQVIGQRMQQLKAQRYDHELTMKLASKLDDSDPTKQALLRQSQQGIDGCEQVLRDLQDELDGVSDSASNGNRQQRRAAARKTKKLAAVDDTP